MLTIAVFIGRHRLHRKHIRETARKNAFLMDAARAAAEVEL